MKQILLSSALLTCLIGSIYGQTKNRKQAVPQNPVIQQPQPPKPEDPKPVAGDPSKDNVAIYPFIAANFPQRFKFMAVGSTEIKKKLPVLATFKIWAGSDNGIRLGDLVEIYTVSYVTNPNTQKRVEEKTNIGFATITAINSGSTSTCEVYKPQRYGAAMLDAVSKTPDLVVIEYTGGVKPKGFFDL